jgi:DNA-binding Xre family transcriptional regulator
MKTNVKKIHYLCNIKNINMEDINRIKVVLVEKKRTSKWLSEQMGVAPSTVSKWCTNSSQPDLGNLLKIADLLEVDIKELLVREYKQYLLSQESV